MEESHYLLELVHECCAPPEDLPVTLDRPLRELRMDSMKMIQIVFELETRFEIELEEHRLFQVEQLGDLLYLVLEARLQKTA